MFLGDDVRCAETSSLHCRYMYAGRKARKSIFMVTPVDLRQHCAHLQRRSRVFALGSSATASRFLFYPLSKIDKRSEQLTRGHLYQVQPTTPSMRLCFRRSKPLANIISENLVYAAADG